MDINNLKKLVEAMRKAEDVIEEKRVARKQIISEYEAILVKKLEELHVGLKALSEYAIVLMSEEVGVLHFHMKEPLREIGFNPATISFMRDGEYRLSFWVHNEESVVFSSYDGVWQEDVMEPYADKDFSVKHYFASHTDEILEHLECAIADKIVEKTRAKIIQSRSADNLLSERLKELKGELD